MSLKELRSKYWRSIVATEDQEIVDDVKKMEVKQF